MHSARLYLLIFAVFVVLPVAVGTRRGFAHARHRVGVPADRNPGPEGGYVAISWALRHLPGWFMRLATRVGTAVGYWTLPGQRAHSREYLRLVLGREPTHREGVAHFRAYAEFLLLRLQICDGREPRLRFADGQGDELRALIASKQPALYGTMHVGRSDLVGFFLGDFGGHVHMIRKQVGNSEDTEGLARRYAKSVTFIWINDWSRLILAMNDALRAGHSLAMQCDRPEYSSKLEGFRFLGARRMFPFTIYHLAIMHGLPVVFSYAVPDEADPEVTVVHVLPAYRPRAEVTRQENFAAARAHFQTVLDAVEAQLRRTPYLWFNYTPMNPPCDAAERDAAGTRRARGSVRVLGGMRPAA